MSYESAPEYAEIHTMVSEHFRGNHQKVDQWFESPNPLLGGVAPCLMLFMGKGDRLRRLVNEWLAGNHA